MNHFPKELAEIIDTHRALFGGFTMNADGAQPPADPPNDGGEEQQEQSAEDKLAALIRERDELQRTADSRGDYDTLKQRLTELETANQSEQEKARALAKAEGEAEGASRWRAVAIQHAVRNAATAAGVAARAGEPDVVGALIDALDTSKLVTDNGDIDVDKIAAIVAPLARVSPDEQASQDASVPAFFRAPSGGAKGDSVAQLERHYAEKYKN